MKTDWDIIVVGAGPGGSSTAANLAKKGLKVCLLEKRQEVGVPKRCGEGLSVGSMKMIEENMGAKIPEKCIAQMIDGAVCYAPSGKEIVIQWGKNTGAVVERKMFDKWLAIQAANLGAYVQAKTEVTDVIKEGDKIVGVKANFEGDEFDLRAKVVVACDGVESTLARKAGLNTTNELINISSGFQYEMAGIKNIDEHKIHLWFGSEIAPRGYVWIFPKGNGIANVGIGVGVIDKTAKYYLDKWINNNPSICEDASIIEVNSGGIPVGGFLENMVLNGFVVVGDAAHQVNPIHGGGMKEATVAGKIAADVIAKGIEQDNVSQEILSEYNKLWWDERGHSLEKVQKLREVVEKLDDNGLNMLAENLSGDDLVELSRGSKLGALAKILMKKPSLIKLAKHLI